MSYREVVLQKLKEVVAEFHGVPVAIINEETLIGERATYISMALVSRVGASPYLYPSDTVGVVLRKILHEGEREVGLGGGELAQA